MKAFTAVVLATILLAGAATATASEHGRQAALYEVEVSLWELVAAAMYHIGDPTAEGTILHGSEPGTTPAQEFAKQKNDVATHWASFTAGASAGERDAIADFEAAYATFLAEADTAMKMSESGMTPELRAQTLRMWVAAHRADDIIDSQLQPGDVR